ncbi:MAG: DUF1579 family protein [Wenzhouxiangellaceae bacterium]|nr:DUF1579 family protein [Wenzhouxiangellaceae bacterium]
MNERNRRIAFCAALLLAPGATLAQVSEESDPSQVTVDDAPGFDAGMMEAWEEASEIGAAHRRLAEQVGDWHAELTMWMTPDAEPEHTTSAVTRHTELGGRVLRETWAGDFLGAPFEGVGRIGYDNVTEQYWSTWTDNWSTGLMVMSGDYDESEDRYEFHGEYIDPASGETVRMRSVWTFPSATTEKMDTYESRGNGEERLTMRVKMTRR